MIKELIEKEGITIVMTTHDPKLMDYGDLVYEIGDGEIVSIRRNQEGEQANE